MASKKKKPEGIALLSMYNDEEDDEEMEDIADEDDEQEQEQHEQPQHQQQDSSNVGEDDANRIDASDSAPPADTTPRFVEDGANLKISSLGPPTPSHSITTRPSRKGSLTIVDYGHDETAMSPEADAEEGEIVGIGRVTFGDHLQTGNENVQTPSGAVQVLTPNAQATSPQSAELPESLQSDMPNHAAAETEVVDIEVIAAVSEEEQKGVDPLDKFLPPPPTSRCSDELQEKINKFLAYKRAGKSFNAEVRNRKDYRNPDFLLHAVRYQDIDQIGSCFSKEVFDPNGYDKSDYYDEIEADMKREMERKEQERKKSQKLEFVAGQTQPAAVTSAPKINIPIPGVSSVSTSGLLSLPTAPDSGSRDGRQNKKSKWDKVDSDRRNTLQSGGQDNLSTTVAHAALLSAANAGTGYSAFAQQRRREAEEKRSSERKLDRRS
ncbi:SAP30-binding protein [Dillenia turbinata]|uniref:SAP30-binding protein n=1 Tax=Dillenia turbinata TaxID=194707 RepID=A0AAN8YYL1_9MAGN